MVSGDLTGKAIVPVVERPDGTYEAHTRDILGEDRVAKTADELKTLEEIISNVGYYPKHMTPEEVTELRKDPALLHAELTNVIDTRIQEWLALADERLAGKSTRFFMMPGNDDPLEIGDMINRSSRVINPEGKVIELDADHEMISLGYSNSTPWKTYREISEDELADRIERMARLLKKPNAAIFNFHVPPYDTPLDSAPVLDENLRPKVVMGDLLRAPVGSKAVRASIEKYQPLLGLHGHIHESGGEFRLGRTLCLNPGSEYASGILRGYVFEINEKGISKYSRIEG
jgi:Icc-related predicted phosphoesterase